MSIDDLLTRNALEVVAADEDGAHGALNEARLHVESARAIAASGANGAYQLAYDAARKAVMASMRAAGFRVRKGEGSHAVTAEYAADAIDRNLGKRLETMRRRRNRSEYGQIFFDQAAVADAIEVATALISAVEA